MGYQYFSSRKELLEILHRSSFGWGIGQWKNIHIYCDETIVGRRSATISPRPKSSRIIDLKTPIEVEIFLNRNLQEDIQGEIYVHNACGSYKGF